MVNLPGGHQQSLMPATSRSSPALAPTKGSAWAGGGSSLAGGTFVLASRWHPIKPAIRRNPAQRPQQVGDIALPPRQLPAAVYEVGRQAPSGVFFWRRGSTTSPGLLPVPHRVPALPQPSPTRGALGRVV